MLPITGPFTRTTGSNTAGFVKYQTWYRQKKPYNLRLTFDSTTYYRVKGSWSVNSFHTIPPSWLVADVRNRASKSFDSKLGEFASMAVTLAERRQAISMIAMRASQLVRFGRALSRGRFQAAANALGLNEAHLKRMDLRRGSRHFAANYLEFHFGWAPLVMDIGNAVEVLQSGIPLGRIRGRASGKASSTSVSGSPGKPGYLRRQQINTVRCQIIADVKITNPDLFLANALGFTNPATVAWELVPFSFIVDWFVSVGDFLQGMSAHLGVSFSEPATTMSDLGTVDSFQIGTDYYSTIFHNVGGHAIVKRTRALARPTIAFKPFRGFSVRRGLAAVSLLLQQLRSQ